MRRNSRSLRRPTAAFAEAGAAGGLFLAAALVFAVRPLVAATDHVADIAAIVAASTAGATETNGWTMSSSLDGYADGCIRFNAKADTLLSPRYPAPIVRLVCKVRCSSTAPTRSLAVLDAEMGQAKVVLSSCEKTERLEDRVLELDAAEKIYRLKFALVGSGSTGWGLGALTVVTADGASRPFGLTLERATATQATFSWTNGEHSVSNMVELSAVTALLREETLSTCTFDNFTTAGKGNAVSYDARMPLENAPLYGVNVYAPTNFASGVCQIGTGDKLGSLFHPGFDDFRGMSLRLVACRYPKDREVTCVSYLDGEATNVIASLTLTDDFEEYRVDLSSVPAYAPIRIGYVGAKSNRRVWVDSIAFIRAEGEVREKVAAGVFAASEGPVSFTTRLLLPLSPQGRWVLAVRGMSADGVISDAVEWAFVTETARGMSWLVK